MSKGLEKVKQIVVNITSKNPLIQPEYRTKKTPASWSF